MTTTENNVAAQAGDEPMPCTCPSGDGSLRWPCPQHPPELDVVVEANRALLHARSQLGIKKYGGTLDTMRHSRRALLQHALEEALDLANYLQADIQAIDREAAQVSPRATADVEREGGALHDALIRCCKELPEGYLVRVEVERSAGWVEWFGPENLTTGNVIDGEGHLSDDVAQSLAAIATTKPGA